MILASLPSLGEWIEILNHHHRCQKRSGLSLRWESGLKSDAGCAVHKETGSLPSLGEWIEIWKQLEKFIIWMSLPSLGEWIEITHH